MWSVALLLAQPVTLLPPSVGLVGLWLLTSPKIWRMGLGTALLLISVLPFIIVGECDWWWLWILSC